MTILEANRIIGFGVVIMIWLVQLVIYPSFRAIDRDRFREWHSGYTRAITLVVAPLLLSQIVMLAWLLLVGRSLWVAGSVLTVAVAWIVTAGESVPCHNRLQSDGIKEQVIARLIATNRIRTIAWTLSFIFLFIAR